MASDNIRYGRGRFRRLKKPVDDPIKEALRPSNAPPPAWMGDRSLLPKKPPPSKPRADGWLRDAEPVRMVDMFDPGYDQ